MAKILRQYKSEIYGNYRKSGALYGLAGGLVMSAFVIFMRIIILPVNTPTGYGTDIAMLVVMLFCSYQYRKKMPEGKVFFKELIQMNLWLGGVASIVYGLFLFLYGNVMDTDFFGRCAEDYVTNALNCEKPEADIQRMVDAYRSYKAVHWASIGAFRSAVMAIIEAFIAALLFRTEKNVPKK